MQRGYFDSDTYHTPEKEHLSFRERILLNNRLYFTWKYIDIVFRTRKQAVRKLYDTKAWTDSSFYIFRFIEKTGGRFHITGMENITKSEGPVLFISNHMSTLETMIFPCIIAPIAGGYICRKGEPCKTSPFWRCNEIEESDCCWPDRSPKGF